MLNARKGMDPTGFRNPEMALHQDRPSFSFSGGEIDPETGNAFFYKTTEQQQTINTPVAGRGGDNAGLSSTTTTVITDEKKWIVKDEPELSNFETKGVEGDSEAAFLASDAWSPSNQSLRSPNPAQDDDRKTLGADFSNPLHPGSALYSEKSKLDTDPQQKGRPVRKDSIGSMYDFDLEANPSSKAAFEPKSETAQSASLDLSSPDMDMAYGSPIQLQKEEPPMMATQGLLDIDEMDNVYNDDIDNVSPANIDFQVSRTDSMDNGDMLQEASFDQEFMSYLASE